MKDTSSHEGRKGFGLSQQAPQDVREFVDHPARFIRDQSDQRPETEFRVLKKKMRVDLVGESREPRLNQSRLL